MIGRKPGSKGQAGDAPRYRQVFITHVHQLLQLGYGRLTPNACSKYQETEITGELVRAMDEVIDEAASGWLRYFSVHDDPPVNAPGRLGKARRRLDIKIVSGQKWPRSRFSFEAKRLSENHPVGDYLGREGLGCFVSGAYARDEDEAGMLGYVQAGDAPGWAGKIEKKVNAPGQSFSSLKDRPWRRQQFKDGPEHVFVTHHARPSLNRDVVIYHTLLEFC